MNNPLIDYLRCPDQYVGIALDGTLASDPGFFQFGPDTICFGQHSCGTSPNQSSNPMPDAFPATRYDANCVRIPFDLSQVVDNLRLERYRVNSPQRGNGFANLPLSSRLYYFVRPVLPVAVRKHLQRIQLRGWDKISFPNWPVDTTVETLFERVLTLSLKNSGQKRIPFIWFWPEGATSCVMMTHDVEEPAGRDFCDQLMDMDEKFGIPSSFQVVPEARYSDTKKLVDEIWRRGFEVNVHDLNHDGALFADRQEFIRRAKQINAYAREFRSQGFRSGAMYRRQDWYEAFDLSYDMSVPNVAHLEPQLGGCCTVMPYFIGNLLELPLTTIQDYSLFHILGDYSINLWKKQIDTIRQRNGLISFITHPDYLIEHRARQVYVELLTYLGKLREPCALWFALPGEVNRWWRNRNEMQLVPNGDSWRIEGPESERARLGYAALKDDHLVLELDDHT